MCWLVIQFGDAGHMAQGVMSVDCRDASRTVINGYQTQYQGLATMTVVVEGLVCLSTGIHLVGKMHI